MNLVVLCPHFAPDVAPTGDVMTRIALELIERGHRLHVVTALPWYQRHAIEPGWDGQLVRGEVTEWGRNKAGTVTGLTAAVGETVTSGAVICEIKD